MVFAKNLSKLVLIIVQIITPLINKTTEAKQVLQITKIQSGLSSQTLTKSYILKSGVQKIYLPLNNYLIIKNLEIKVIYRTNQINYLNKKQLFIIIQESNHNIVTKIVI